jgi:hypothetical protein
MFRRDEIVKLKSRIPNISGKELIRLVGHHWSKIKETPEAQVYMNLAEEENKKIVVPDKSRKIKTKRRQPSGEIKLSKYF